MVFIAKLAPDLRGLHPSSKSIPSIYSGSSAFLTNFNDLIYFLRTLKFNQNSEDLPENLYTHGLNKIKLNDLAIVASSVGSKTH